MPDVTLLCGNASLYAGPIPDLILTNPYAPLPPALLGVPALISNFTERKALCEEWCGGPLIPVSQWGRGLRNTVWVTRWPFPTAFVDLRDLWEVEETPGRGWFPVDLPKRLLRAYALPGMVVLDPFMGRGTVGRACKALGMDFIGVDLDPSRVALAREFLQ